MKNLLRITTTFAILALTLGGCAKNKGAGNGAANDGDYVNGSALPERTEGVSFMSGNVDRNKFAPVHFSFDSFTVEPGEQGKVQQVAEFMRSAGNSVIVAGFTDEHGTPEYNRGLGERRAQAVREALIRAGAPGGKIQTVSFGAEMPADPSSNEAAWAKNRRAEFGVVR
jgi:peptidoglycan-associated lipoprotein